MLIRFTTVTVATFHQESLFCWLPPNLKSFEYCIYISSWCDRVCMQLAVAGFIWPLSKLPKTFYLLPPSSFLESRGMWVFVRSRILAILAPFWTGIQLFSLHILNMILITVKEIRYSRKLAVLATQNQVFPLSSKWNARTIKYTSTSSPSNERKPHKYQMLVFSHLTFTIQLFPRIMTNIGSLCSHFNWIVCI